MKIEFKEYDSSVVIRFNAQNLKDAAFLTRFAMNHKTGAVELHGYVTKRGDFQVSAHFTKRDRASGFLPQS